MVLVLPTTYHVKTITMCELVILWQPHLHIHCNTEISENEIDLDFNVLIYLRKQPGVSCLLFFFGFSSQKHRSSGFIQGPMKINIKISAQ